MSENAQELFDKSWLAVASRRDKVTDRVVQVPALQPVGDGGTDSRFSSTFPALRHLRSAIELADKHVLADLSRLFAETLHELSWSQNPSYTPENVDNAFLNGYAYAGVGGPDCPVRCAAPRGGFMLMGPNVTYQDHRHAPREVYLVMTPGSEWRLDGGDWFAVAPGDLIFHDAWQMHATRTHDQPMLAFAGWLEAGDRSAIEI